MSIAIRRRGILSFFFFLLLLLLFAFFILFSFYHNCLTRLLSKSGTRIARMYANDRALWVCGGSPRFVNGNGVNLNKFIFIANNLLANVQCIYGLFGVMKTIVVNMSPQLPLLTLWYCSLYRECTVLSRSMAIFFFFIKHTHNSFFLCLFL